jgi:hypothetical protein
VSESADLARRASLWRRWAVGLLIALSALGFIGSFIGLNSELPPYQIGGYNFSCGTADNPQPIPECKSAANTRREQSGLGALFGILIGLGFFFGFRKQAQMIEEDAWASERRLQTAERDARLPPPEPTSAAGAAARSQPPTTTEIGSTPERSELVAQLGALRDAGVLTSEQFNVLKTHALRGGVVSRLDELERLDALRRKGYLEESECHQLSLEIIVENLMQTELR